MTVVIDASVGVKWFVEEPRSSAARKVLEESASIIVPDIFLPEVSNALFKKILLKEVTFDQGTAIVSNIPLLIDHFIPSSQLADRAFELGVTFNHPVYDCLYLALAERESIVLMTDDAKLNAIARKAKLSRWVRTLK